MHVSVDSNAQLDKVRLQLKFGGLLCAVGIAQSRKFFGRIDGQMPALEPLSFVLIASVYRIRLYCPVVALLPRLQLLRLLLSAEFSVRQCAPNLLPAPRTVHCLLEAFDRLLETVEISVPDRPGTRDHIEASILQQVIQLLPSRDLLVMGSDNLGRILGFKLRRLLL